MLGERGAVMSAQGRAQMFALGRDLHALRDWYARTAKPGLRRAVLADANRLIRRMERFAAAHALDRPTDPAA